MDPPTDEQAGKSRGSLLHWIKKSKKSPKQTANKTDGSTQESPRQKEDPDSDPIQKALRRLEDSAQRLYQTKGVLEGTIKPENWEDKRTDGKTANIDTLAILSLVEGIKGVEQIIRKLLEEQDEKGGQDIAQKGATLEATYRILKAVAEKITPGLKTVLSVVIQANAVSSLISLALIAIVTESLLALA